MDGVVLKLCIRMTQELELTRGSVDRYVRFP